MPALPSPTALEFRLVAVPGGHGADDYEDHEGEAWTIEAWRDGSKAGWLDYNFQDDGGIVWVRWIEAVVLRARVATDLVVELRRRHPVAAIDTGGFTPEGELFWASLFA